MSKKPPTSRVYYTQIPPRQKYFPPRRRAVKRVIEPLDASISSLSSIRHEKQDTMTQYFPRIDTSQSFVKDFSDSSRTLDEMVILRDGKNSDREIRSSGWKRRRVARSNSPDLNQMNSKRQSTLIPTPDSLSSAKRERDRIETSDQKDSHFPLSPSPSLLTRMHTPRHQAVKLEVPSSQSPSATPLTRRKADMSPTDSSHSQRTPLQELPARAVTHIDNSLSHRNPGKERLKEERKEEYEKSRGSASSSRFDCSDGTCDLDRLIVKQEDLRQEDGNSEGECEYDQENYDPVWALKHHFDEEEMAVKKSCLKTSSNVPKLQGIDDRFPYSHPSSGAAAASFASSSKSPRASQATTVDLTQSQEVHGNLHSPITPSHRRIKQARHKPSPLRNMSSIRCSVSPSPSPLPHTCERLQSPGSPTPVRQRQRLNGKARLIQEVQDSQFSDEELEDEDEDTIDRIQLPAVPSSPLPRIWQDAPLPMTASNGGGCGSSSDNYGLDGCYSPISSVVDSAQIQTVSQLMPDSMLVDDDDYFNNNDEDISLQTRIAPPLFER